MAGFVSDQITKNGVQTINRPLYYIFHCEKTNIEDRLSTIVGQVHKQLELARALCTHMITMSGGDILTNLSQVPAQLD